MIASASQVVEERVKAHEVREEDEASLQTERVFEDLEFTQRIKYIDEIEI